MKTNARVLVTAAGTIVAQGIIKSLKLASSRRGASTRYRIIAADMSPQAVGLYRSDLGVVVPEADAPDYIDSIIRICKEQEIQALFVGADEELSPISGAKARIERESGALVLTNPINVVSIGADKWRTIQFLKKNRLPHPESSLPEGKGNFIRQTGFPIVVKPREGHGSLHFYIVRSRDEMNHAISAIQGAGWRPILQEYLEDQDQEFTSGVTIDKDGKHVMSSISIRRTLKNGQTHKAVIDDFPDVRRSAEEAATKLGARGAINVQARIAGGEPKIFEINPRFSASCPIRAVAGVNEPDIVFRNSVLGENIAVEKYRKLVCIRYLNEVYIPYDTYQEAVSEERVEGADSFIPSYF